MNIFLPPSNIYCGPKDTRFMSIWYPSKKKSVNCVPTFEKVHQGSF